MGKLKDWANKRSKYIRLADGDSVIGIYLGFKEVQSGYDPEKVVMQYLIEIAGENKYFESGAGSVARQFDEIDEGAMVKISRKGKDTKTKYTVEEVGEKKK